MTTPKYIYGSVASNCCQYLHIKLSITVMCQGLIISSETENIAKLYHYNKFQVQGKAYGWTNIILVVVLATILKKEVRFYYY